MVRRVFFFGVVLGTGLVLAAPGGAQQQDNPSQTQQSQSGQAGSQKKDQKKSTAQGNPFPEQKSEAAAKQAQQDDGPSAPAPQTAPKGKSTADQNPFPEEQSEKAAHQEQPNPDQGNGSGKGGFSSSQVKGLDMPGTNSESPGGSAPAFDPKLAKKDTQVGTFYLQSGDFKGAYDRFVEATRTDPGNAEAVYGLGESALRLGKNDVALRNFRLYLSALPDGPHAKDVRKAMKKMGAEPPA
ncbi:MAG: tetratricopeptide repeat protein [Acidobacteriaceae bacterium]